MTTRRSRESAAYPSRDSVDAAHLTTSDVGVEVAGSAIGGRARRSAALRAGRRRTRGWIPPDSRHLQSDEGPAADAAEPSWGSLVHESLGLQRCGPSCAFRPRNRPAPHTAELRITRWGLMLDAS